MVKNVLNIIIDKNNTALNFQDSVNAKISKNVKGYMIKVTI